MTASDKMYRYAYSILKNKEMASDAVQECLIKVWEKRDSLSEVKNIESWLMRITRNQCYDFVKLNKFTISTDSNIDIEGDNKDHLQFKDMNKWLDKIISKLPEKSKEIFHLREVEGMSYQEIADVVGISLSNVKITIFRVREKIRTDMQKVENYGIAN